MPATNRGRVEQGLELLRQGLAPFIEREIRRALRKRQVGTDVLHTVAENPRQAKAPLAEWDAAALLRTIWDLWSPVFRFPLGPAERSLVSELRGHRNRWAHQEPFSSDEAYRAIDSAARLLTAVAAPQANELDALKNEMLRLRFEEQRRNAEKQQARRPLIESEAAAGGLKPWREVIQPHPDVATGKYRQAEFAADLWQVHRDEGADEYRKPDEFFRRTYLTESLGALLVDAARRLAGTGGDPVVELQTNFGGGKTHSMLALYHLFSGADSADLAGVDSLLADAKIVLPAGVRRVVLVGNRIAPGQPSLKDDGTAVHTLWGEIAWQLGGKEAYERIRLSDERATSPGQALADLFRDYGPCLLLMDEWVAYARQLVSDDLPGGTFETQFTFAQTLTESAKQVPNCLVVVSLPASNMAVPERSGDRVDATDEEVGGVHGREALSQLRNVIERVASPWRPATAEEGFEIVRRRLFQALPGNQFKQRDLTARGFGRFYRERKTEFPAPCREGDYEKRIRAAYPIHPEVFDRLYDDWSTLLRFQRTRGVLRLMASVIHSLWESGDRSPLILPSSIPIDDARVQPEITRYLTDNWTPILAKDVDGPSSLPFALDKEIPSLGKLQAARRVTRTVFLGSAPKRGASQRGLDDQRMRLGCALPGESATVFDDALRRLAARATHLYREESQSWFDTQPTVTRIAETRAEERSPDDVAREMRDRVRAATQERVDFAAVHSCPESEGDVPDLRETRLVVLPGEATFRRGGGSAAEKRATAILESRGSGPRMYRNTLVFLAPDEARLSDLDEAVRSYLAWASIVADTENLNLNVQQAKQAKARMADAEETIGLRLPEVWKWMIAPTQAKPGAPVAWDVVHLTTPESLVVRASARAVRDEWLVTGFGPTMLRPRLDEAPLWRGPSLENRQHVEVRQLADDFAQYLFLPRLRSPKVLAETIGAGVGLMTWLSESFAFADRYDEKEDRYLGLRAGQAVSVSADAPGLVVKAERAWKQMQEELPVPPVPPPPPPKPNGGNGPDPIPPPPPKKRFHATVDLDPLAVGKEAGKIAEAVIGHLAGFSGAEVKVSIEIEATADSGFSEQIARTVSENSRTLKFRSHEFESE